MGIFCFLWRFLGSLLLTRATMALLPKILDGAKYVRTGILVTGIRSTVAQETIEPFVN